MMAGSGTKAPVTIGASKPTMFNSATKPPGGGLFKKPGMGLMGKKKF